MRIGYLCAVNIYEQNKLFTNMEAKRINPESNDDADIDVSVEILSEIIYAGSINRQMIHTIICKYPHSSYYEKSKSMVKYIK